MENLKIKIELLKSMKKIRFTEEMIAARYSENKMRCPTHLSTGQEGPAAACGLALRKNDFAVSTHRAHAHYLGKGGDLNAMIAEIYGKSTGCSAGLGGSMHLVDQSVGFMASTAIVGGTIPVGVGLALSIQLKKTDQVSVVFLGDAATEEGVFYESLNFAIIRKLPVLFICENNLYSVYSPLKVRQPENRPIHQWVGQMGLAAEQVDGNDVFQSYERISSAVAAIRQNQGPQFIELTTYRWREHCGPHYDNDIGYRSEKEFLEWKEKDPIAKLEKELLENSQLKIDEIKEMEKTIQDEIEQAFTLADKAPVPILEDAFHALYQ